MALVADIISRIRRAADYVNSTFLSDANDLLPWINGSHRELYELLVAVYGPPYFMVTGDVTVSATERVELGSVFKILRVDRAIDQQRKPMRPFNLTDEVLSDQAQDWGSGVDVRYHFEGLPGPYSTTGIPALRFTPRPTGSHLVRVYYVPPAETFDSFSIANIVGAVDIWDEYIVVDCAIKALRKGRRDVSDFLLAKAELKQRIESHAPNRDIGQASTVPDVQESHEGGDWWE